MGNVVAETDTAAAKDLVFGFTGKLLDEASGLQNNLNRWYDPKVGSWLSEDPISFDGGDANLYRYVANRAVDRVDPSGLSDINPIFGPPNFGNPAPPNQGSGPPQWLQDLADATLPNSGSGDPFADHYYCGNGKPLDLNDVPGFTNLLQLAMRQEDMRLRQEALMRLNDLLSKLPPGSDSKCAVGSYRRILWTGAG
jgi:RHS repeat-associated protein